MAEKNSLDYVAIGKRIKMARNDKGLTQDKLAEAVELSTPYISSVETGSEKIGLSSLVAVANHLGVSVDYLLAGNAAQAESYLQNDIQDMIAACSADERALFLDLISCCYETIKRHGK